MGTLHPGQVMIKMGTTPHTVYSCVLRVNWVELTTVRCETWKISTLICPPLKILGIHLFVMDVIQMSNNKVSYEIFTWTKKNANASKKYEIKVGGSWFAQTYMFC